MCAATMRLGPNAPYHRLLGVGGMGAGLYFALEGNHTLGRNESRAALLLDSRDYFKLHIILHYVSVVLGANPTGVPFHVLPIGRLGDDQQGRRLREEMAGVGMDLACVETVPGQPTMLGVCFQYPDGSGGNITPVNSAANGLIADDLNRYEPLIAGGARCMVLAAPEVSLEVRAHLLSLGTRHGALRVASFISAELPPARAAGMLRRIDLLALNQDEAAALCGLPFESVPLERFLNACAHAVRTEQPAMRLVISAGPSGVYALDGSVWTHVPAAAVDVVSTAGAGDALLGGLLAGLAAGLPFAPASGRPALGSAVELGVLLAGVSVTSPHTIHPGADLNAVLTLAAELDRAVPPALIPIFYAGSTPWL